MGGNPLEIFVIVTTICSAVTGVSAVIAVFKSVYSTAKSPEREQDTKIKELEIEIEGMKIELEKIKKILDNDNRRINSVKEGERVTHRSLLALMEHGIDGNNIEELKKAKEDLNSYLIDSKS